MLELRRFSPSDEEAVWDLHNIALQDTGAHRGNGPWDEDLRAIPDIYLEEGGEFLVGSLDGRLVAMGALRRMTGRVGEIKRMRVHPLFQRRGFGRQVLAALEERARELGYRAVRLDTAVVQTAAQSLYRSAGYREVGRGQIGGLDVVYFEKRLG